MPRRPSRRLEPTAPQFLKVFADPAESAFERVHDLGHATRRPTPSPCSAPGRRSSHSRTRASISASLASGCFLLSFCRSIASPISKRARVVLNRAAISSSFGVAIALVYRIALSPYTTEPRTIARRRPHTSPKANLLTSPHPLTTLNHMVQHQGPLDDTFAALSDPTRRGILERLGRGEASISDLAASFAMSLTGLKKHVQILEEAGLVVTEKVGRVRTCRLGPRRLDDESAWIDRYRQMLKERYDRLEEFLERTKGDL